MTARCAGSRALPAARRPPRAPHSLLAPQLQPPTPPLPPPLLPAAFPAARSRAQLLNLGPNDTVLMITTGGCNVLDMALECVRGARARAQADAARRGG